METTLTQLNLEAPLWIMVADVTPPPPPRRRPPLTRASAQVASQPAVQVYRPAGTPDAAVVTQVRAAVAATQRVTFGISATEL